jgi:hypothetical protein
MTCMTQIYMHEKLFNVSCTHWWGLHTIGLHLKNVIEGNHKQFVENDMLWTYEFYKTQFCKQIMLSCVIKFEIFESILFTHLKFVSESMLYNDDGFLINIGSNNRIRFYTSIIHLFLNFLNYGWLDLSLINFFNKCFRNW